MKKIFEYIKNYIQKTLMPEDISITHRLCNLIYASTIIGTFGTLIASIFLTPSPMTLVTIMAALVVISISFYISVYKRKQTIAALIIILFIDEIIFPLMYISNGGIRSGMPIWFVLGLMFSFLVLEGKLCLVIFLVSGLTLSGLFFLETAGIINPEPLTGYVWAADVVQSLVLVALIFGAFFKLQSFIYKKQAQSLRAKEKELTEIMKEIEAANNAKSEFLANMSHEIRTPINAIMGMNEIILRDSNEEETLQNAGRIKTASANLLSLVNDILDFTKVESGKMEFIYEDYPLTAVLNDCFNLINLRAFNKGLSFNIVNDPEIPLNLYGDRFHISQVVSNLLTNAVKYTAKGEITLNVSYEKLSDDRINLIFSVKDTGIGIAKSDMDKLFRNFQRIDERRNRTIEGTGLGLALTARLLEQMGGSIKAESEVNVGSTFTAIIPQTVKGDTKIGVFAAVSDAKPQKQNDKYKESFTAPTACILAVDDVKTNLIVVKGLLKYTKVQLDLAGSGAEALKLSEGKKYDVILMDHMMPEMDGIETLHTLKKKNNINMDTPVVVLTANAIKGAEEKYYEAGFDEYLSKPVKGIDLENMLLKYIPPEKIES